MTTEQNQQALKSQTKSDDLKFIRAYDFRLIPRRLFDQVKGSNYRVDKILEFNQIITANNAQLLYVMVTDDSVIHGFLWAEFDPVCQWVYVKLLSVDKDFQDSHQVENAIDFLRDELADSGANRIVMATTRPDAYEKQGMKPIDTTFMESEL